MGFRDPTIAAAVDGIHKQLGYKDPPFSISRVIEEMFPAIDVVQRRLNRHGEIEVYPTPLGSGKQAIIVYHDGSHHSTQRFTVAHELAHWLFDFEQGASMPQISCGVRDERERRADRFAAEVLVPMRVLHEHVKFNLRPDADDEDAVMRRDQSVQRLASRFNVSLMCMKNRIRDLGIYRKSLR